MTTRLSAFCDRIIEAGWLAAAAIVPVFFNLFGQRMFELPKVVLLSSLVVVMVLAWAVKTLETASHSMGGAWRRFLARPLVLPVLCLALIYVIATFTSIAPAISFWGLYERVQGTVSILTYLTFFLMVAFHLRTRAQFHRLVSVSLLASFGISVYGIMQHFGVDPVTWSSDSTDRVTGTMGNPIFFSAYLLMVVPLTVARLLNTVRPMLKGKGDSRWQGILLTVAYVLVLLAQLLAILFTSSRGPWLGLAAAAVVLAILLPLRRRRLRLAAVAAALVVAAGVFLVLINVPKGPLEGLKSKSSYLERLGSLNAEQSSIHVRLLIWRGDGTAKGVLGMVTANPLRTIIGYGPDTMFLAFGPFSPASLTGYYGPPSTTARSHNDFLDYLVNTGMLGLLAYLAVVASFYFFAIRCLWRTDDFYEQLFGIALVAAVTGHLVESFVGIAVTATQTQFWLYLGAAAALAVGGWQAAPATGQQAAVPQIVSPRKKRLKERRKRRQEASISRRGLGRLRAADYALIVYLVATFVVTAAFVKGLKLGWQPSALVAVAFIWVVVGVLLAAVWVASREPPRPLWRASRWWVYTALVACTVFALTVLLKPLVADIFFKTGDVADRAQQYERSIPAYLAAISYAPEQDHYYLTLGRLYLRMAVAAPAGRKGDKIASVADLFKVKTWAQQGRDDLLDAGLVSLERAQRLDGLRTDNLLNLAQLRRFRAEVSTDAKVADSELQMALQSYLRAVALAPNSGYVRYELGQVYHQRQDYADAVVTYQEALALGYKAADIYDDLGRALAAQSKWEESAAQFRKAMEISPNDWTIRSRLAQVYWELGQAAQATAELENAVKLAPETQRASLEQMFSEWTSKEKR